MAETNSASPHTPSPLTPAPTNATPTELNSTATNSQAISSARYACERCWRRKQKCGREFPACTSCADAGVQCIPRTTEVPIHGQEAAIHHQVGEGYVTTLKRKIEHLETLHRARRPGPGPGPGNSSSNGEGRRGQQCTSHNPSATENGRSSVQDAMNHLGRFALNLAPRPTNAEGQSSTKLFSLSRLLLSKIDTSPHAKQSHAFASINRQEPPLLLSTDHATLMLERYAASVLRKYHFIDTSLLLGAAALISTESAEPSLAATVYLALATVCAASPTSAGILTNQFVTCSSQCSASLKEDDPLAVARTLVSYTIYALYGSSIDASGFAVRAAMSQVVAMGFHRPTPAHSTEQQSRRSAEQKRLFWTLYVLDREIALITGSPHSIQDDDISVQPVSRHEQQESASMAILPIHVEVADHAQLISMLVRSRSKPRLYFTSVYHAWTETRPRLESSSQDVALLEIRLRLHCRFLVALYCLPEAPCTPELAPLGLDESAVQTALDTCLHWLRSLEILFDRGNHLISSLDQLEVAAVGLLCAHVKIQATAYERTGIWKSASEAVLLGVTLLGYLSATHAAAAPLRRMLSYLHIHSGEETAPDSIHEMAASEELPRRIRLMLMTVLAALESTNRAESDGLDYGRSIPSLA